MTSSILETLLRGRDSFSSKVGTMFSMSKFLFLMFPISSYHVPAGLSDMQSMNIYMWESASCCTPLLQTCTYCSCACVLCLRPLYMWKLLMRSLSQNGAIKHQKKVYEITPRTWQRSSSKKKKRNIIRARFFLLIWVEMMPEYAGFSVCLQLRCMSVFILFFYHGGKVHATGLRWEMTLTTKFCCYLLKNKRRKLIWIWRDWPKCCHVLENKSTAWRIGCQSLKHHWRTDVGCICGGSWCFAVSS